MKRAKRLLMLLLTFTPSLMRIAVWRLMGFNIGKNCSIAFLSVIVADNIHIGNDVKISPFAMIYNLKEFRVGSGTLISYFGMIYGALPGATFCAGQRFGMGMFAMIEASAGVELGDFCAIGPRGVLYTHASFLPVSHGYKTRSGAIRAGDYVWMMLDVKVLPGVELGDRVYVMPGTVVSRNEKGPGVLMNSYMKEKDSVMQPSLFETRVDKTFLKEWFGSLFEGINKFALDNYGEDIEARLNERVWTLIHRGETVRFVDLHDQPDGAPESMQYNDHTFLLFCQHSNEVKKLHMDRNWIDCWALDYNLVTKPKMWLFLVQYFMSQHGMYLAETEPDL